MYKEFFRPLLFRADPETVHNITLKILELVQRQPTLVDAIKNIFEYEDHRLENRIFGLIFKNPVGLAAGFDKNAQALEALSALGFSFINAGTMTRCRQEGNPVPRIRRLPQFLALDNNMGFPNDGFEKVNEKLTKLPRHDYLLGASIAPGKTTAAEKVAEEVAALIKLLSPSVDFITIDLSSPNTPGLRRLQGKSYLSGILKSAMRERLGTMPIMVKISPGLSLHELDETLEVIVTEKVDGIEATNTTTQKPPSLDTLKGGLSGFPLKSRSTEIIRYLYRATNGQLPIIGVGGVFNANDVLEKIKAGASAIQLYTGLVYEGPFIVKTINKDLCEYMNKEGISSISKLRGVSA